ncbi:MAG: 50S ribosomal protein L14e [Candidatus Nanoarchaeia archaeon]|nr:50S ribosomal protein L14e [Candidatus Nanoarchaeia archaeon]
MIEVGRVCIKIAGRESMKRCVVVKVLDNNYVEIDGEVKRKKCNIAHLEPLKDKVSIKEGASTAEVKKALEKLGVKVKETKKKEKKERPTKQKKTKTEKPKKVTTKKASKK